MLIAALIFTLLVVAWGSRTLTIRFPASEAPPVVGRDDPLSRRPRIDGRALPRPGASA